jgi:hypothetical protein
MLNPAPVTFACEMVTLAVFAVTVTFCVLRLPTATLPKLSDDVLSDKVPVVGALELGANTTSTQ